MLLWNWRMNIWQKTINAVIIEQRSATAYVINDDFSSLYDDRRLLIKIFILLLFNKLYQVIFNEIISFFDVLICYLFCIISFDFDIDFTLIKRINVIFEKKKIQIINLSNFFCFFLRFFCELFKNFLQYFWRFFARIRFYHKM